jgi:S1-C subfamily serine protease
MAEILRNGRVLRGWLGVMPEDLSALQAGQDVQLPEGGVLVADVYLNSPAYRAGLRSGDIITHLNDQAMDSAQEALAFVAALVPGKIVKIRGFRQGKPYEVMVKVEERPVGRDSN